MKLLTITLLSTLLISACNQKAAEVDGPNPPAVTKSIQIDPGLASATNRFGFTLFNQLHRDDTSATTMISPASVAMALAMTYNGADGETQAAMARALEVSGFSLDSLNAAHQGLRQLLTDPNADITLAIANSLWAREGMAFDEEFLSRNREFYAAEITTLDFTKPEAPSTINSWVNEKTRGKIPSIIDQISNDAILYLVNAIYFKGTWTYQFDKSKSYDGLFHHASGDATRKFMFQETELDYLAGDGFQAVRLPYGKSQRFAMYVFLPDSTTSLNAFTARLSEAQWREWRSQFGKKEGELHLPRFTLTYKETLNDALSAGGMGVVFDPARADFARMIQVAAQNVYISAINHKTFMEVNEEGTEAAAVTSVEIVVTSVRPPESRFVMSVDRPFFCAIADRESGLILFIGTVNAFE